MSPGSACRRLTFALLLLLPLSAATANPFKVVINGRSYHVDSSYNWNEKNYGFGLEYELPRRSQWTRHFMANGFRDSTDNMSYMVGGGLHRRLLESHELGGLYFDVGINAFLMTRKDYNDNTPFPGILPSITVGNRHVGFNVTYLPKIAVRKIMDVDMGDPTMNGVIYVQFKISVDRLLPYY